MLITPLSLLLLSGAAVVSPLRLVNATDATKFFNEYVDASGTLTVTNTAAAVMLTITQGGAVAAAGLAQVYGGANPVLIQGSADTGQVHIGLTTGLSGKNIGAILGNVQGTGGVQVQLADSGTAGGNARGANAVDMQTARTLATQVASGVSATISGGTANTASGLQTTVVGGTGNLASGNQAIAGGNASQATGNWSVALGRLTLADGTASLATGFGARSHGLSGARVHGAAAIAANGDAQLADYVLSGRSTGGAAWRLTADATGTASATNVANIPLNTAWSGTISATARDTSTGNCARWAVPFGMGCLGTAASMVLTTGTVDFGNIIGAVAASGNLVLAADTTNRGLSATFTPANTNTWDVVLVVHAVEVQ